MFTTGQIFFAAFFFVGFLAVIIYSYRKDFKLHKKNYKGVKFVVLGFLLFIVLLFLLKSYLK